jgi:hypothetical protein
LLKEQKDNLFILYQIFLDKENNIFCKADQSPIGRSLKTKQLDTELIELFGTKDMVLVEDELAEAHENNDLVLYE